MTTILQDAYRDLAQKLIEAIGDRDYLNSQIDTDTDDFVGALRFTVIIYRKDERIVEVVPVWWDFRAQGEYDEMQTDFSWKELMEHIPCA